MAAIRVFLATTGRRSRVLRNGDASGGGGSYVSRRMLASITAENKAVDLDEGCGVEERDDLRSRIFRLRHPKRSAVDVIGKWVGEGNGVSAPELRRILKDLRKSQRYKHALEVSEWMVSHHRHEWSNNDFASRIELMCKVFGIDAAERYFDGLPIEAKTRETYTSILHCYASAKLTDKAEDLYRKMESSNIAFDALVYNEMMTMYMSLGQLEKVPSVVEGMKRKKVALDIFSYNLWISSYAAAVNMDRVGQVLDEMIRDPSYSREEGWERYRNLLNVYVASGMLPNSEGENGLVEAEEERFSQREWITYDLLVILYASLGNKSKVDQIWKSLVMTKQKMTSRNRLCIISSYLMLGHTKEAGEVIDQWKRLSTGSDIIACCARLSEALTDVGAVDSADRLHMLLIEKDCASES
ncbi:hypothetical protein MLD38_032391 [Melastoma candidum]|uniref:Uncharacterized protein n=1 Tax=Melastoma candidum TaxID=119954 RepID=A0ACB9M4R5_9MYRT|nr:hypothetical protein MLD38_032391 [Melastoma candidum]